MSTFYAFVVICFFGFCGESWAIYIPPESSYACPHVETLSSLNQTKFSGLWYPSRRSPKRSESLRCLEVMITVNESAKQNKMLFESSGIFLGVRTSTEASLWSLKSEPAKFKVKKTGTKYWILGTDYDSFFVAYSCSRKNHMRSITTEIYTRAREPDQSVIDQAFKIIERTEIRRNSFSKFNQDNCTHT